MCLSILLGGTLRVHAEDYEQLSLSDINNLYRTATRNWVSVHDPSVVHQVGNTFYIVGSHNGFARSSDNMVSWTSVSNDYYGKVNADGTVSRCSFADAYTTHAVKRVTVLVGGTPTEVDFGNFDAKAWAHGNQTDWDISGNMWAPDLVYNPYMKKWCMYMSVNGDAWHSVIVMLSADVITGPYVYQGPIVFSGFINNNVPEISYKKTDLELVLGTQTTLPSRYNLDSQWGDTYPNNIDPCVFWDEDGELWIAYGSWSGGIFMLKLDKQTGLRDYTVTYPLTWDGKYMKSDPYFGTHIAGGYYVSGEGPYIQHIGDYYYLFMSYGGFAPDGGYEMRIFRSQNPDGPYVDAQGTSAIYSARGWNVGPGATTNRGTKLLGAYNQWGFMTVGECAQGHNSAIVDDKGRAFVVYHTKFNDGTIGHQVRVHQLFLNQDGWLCAAPFQFDGETETDATLAAGCQYTKEQLVGEYDVLVHKYRMNHENMEEVTPVKITLEANGRITGALTGTWTLTDGTAYIQLKANTVTYKGVVVQQQVDGTTLKAICFTAMSSSGVSIWGWKMEPQSAIAYTAKNYTLPVKTNSTVSKNLNLFGEGFYGAAIEWESSQPDIISNTGKYNPAAEATKVQLTCRIHAGNYAYEQVLNVTAQKEIVPTGDARSGLLAYYDFDETPTLNRWNEEQRATYGRISSGKAATLEEHPARFGQVAHVFGGTAKTVSFVRFDNPLAGRTDLEGFTVSAWVQRVDDSLSDGLWSFTDRQGQLTTVSQRFFLTGNAYVGFNDGEQWFDINHPETIQPGYIPVGEWALVTVTCSAEDGIAVYVDGIKKAHRAFASSAGEGKTVTASAQRFNYQTLMDFIATAPYMQLGAGSFGGSAEARFDDLMVYDRALTSSDVRALNSLLNRVNDFTPNAPVDVASLYEQCITPASTSIFDLSGRRLPAAPLHRGLYIVGGRKVLVR